MIWGIYVYSLSFLCKNADNPNVTWMLWRFHKIMYEVRTLCTGLSTPTSTFPVYSLLAKNKLVFVFRWPQIMPWWYKGDSHLTGWLLPWEYKTKAIFSFASIKGAYGQPEPLWQQRPLRQAYFCLSGRYWQDLLGSPFLNLNQFRHVQSCNAITHVDSFI